MPVLRHSHWPVSPAARAPPLGRETALQFHLSQHARLCAQFLAASSLFVSTLGHLLHSQQHLRSLPLRAAPSSPRRWAS
eukprot:6199026-Pleurochrysis_carterae.AAC.1